jgi:hypothetical protein
MLMQPHPGKRSRHLSQLLFNALLFCGGGLLVASTSQAKCPPDCVTIYSVVHAAGEDPKVRAKLNTLATQVRVDGARLAGSSTTSLKALAAEINAMPRGDVVTLHTHADAGLAADAAKAQALSRSQALQRELVAAGVQAGRVKISAANN